MLFSIGHIDFYCFHYSLSSKITQSIFFISGFLLQRRMKEDEDIKNINEDEDDELRHIGSYWLTIMTYNLHKSSNITANEATKDKTNEG